MEAFRRCICTVDPFKRNMLDVSKLRYLLGALALEVVYQAAQLEFALLIRNHRASSVVAFVIDNLESPDLYDIVSHCLKYQARAEEPGKERHTCSASHPELGFSTTT